MIVPITYIVLDFDWFCARLTCGYPITGIQFEQLQIGYLEMDTYAIRAVRASITYT